MKLAQGMLRYILVAAGCLCTGLGALGVFVPLLPTVPFLLLATYCFGRSSPRLKAWLFDHPLLGNYLQNYLIRKGLSKRQLVTSLSSLWISILLAAFFAPIIWVKILLLTIATAVSIHLLSMQRI